MKIGILTVYDSANYGAFLQAYASKSLLESWGHEVYFIKIRSEEERKMVYTKRIHGIRDVYPYYRNYKFNIEKFELMKKDIDKLKVIEKEDKEALAKLDCILIGSDEVWNVNVPLFQKEIFFGGNLNNENVIAFAVSAGMADFDKFSALSTVCEQMKKLKFIAARDENTQNIAAKITGRNADLVCDPTLMVPKDYFPKKERKIKEPYMLVYSYYVSPKMVMTIKKFAKKKNLKIVSVCTRLSFCDYNLNISPLEFSSIIANAEYVFTSTFHGTIFTLMNHKNCVVMSEQKKVNDLLKRYHKEDRKLKKDCSYEEFEKRMCELPDYSEFESAKEQIAENTQNILKSYLQTL